MINLCSGSPHYIQWDTGHPIFFSCEQAACNVFFLVNKIMELRQKFVSQPFTKYNTTLFLNLVGKCGEILIFFSLRKTFLNPSECNLSLADLVLYDQIKRLPQDISEPWLQWLKLIYHPSSITNNVSKNWSMTLKGLRGVVLRALIEKTPNFWPIEPIELKFWHLILIMECLKISLRGSHGSTFGPLWWP